MQGSQPIILAIESSCDETAAAVINNGIIKSNCVASQSIHEKYGGVVPELASRAHQHHIFTIVQNALSAAQVSSSQLDAIAYTKGPGLLGSLLVGNAFAKSMAFSLNIPLIGVHHMHAHVLAHFIDDRKPSFPFLCLTVSGGHTQIVHVLSPINMQVIGETKDDAIGEAFDKCAKLLGLPYPGGPELDRLAKKGNKQAFSFPIHEMDGFNYSFSGIKTAFLYFLQKQSHENPHFIQDHIIDLAASIQHTLVQMVLVKLKKAAISMNIKHIAIAGGVAANSELRQQIQLLGKTLGAEVYIPHFSFCTDNAAMIAMAAHFYFLNQQWVSLTDVPEPRMPF